MVSHDTYDITVSTLVGVIGAYQKCTVFGPTGLFHSFAKPL